MCDCGDPDALYHFCKEHEGPYTTQKDIDKYIEEVFKGDLFDKFFMKFTEYLILTEKCRSFMREILGENIKKAKEIEDVYFLKNNFGIVFQNFLNFLYLLAKDNMGMLHLIANYLLKNNLQKDNNKNERGYTTHSCIQIMDDDIKITYRNKVENENIYSLIPFKGAVNHKCECPFIRLIISNFRDNIKPYESEEDNQNEELLLFLTHNLFLRKSFLVNIFFLFKDIVLNNNTDLNNTRHQFYLEESIAFVAQKSDIIENMFDSLYYFIKNKLDIVGMNVNDLIILEKILAKLDIYVQELKFFTKMKVIPFMSKKTIILKKIIDIFCLLFHKVEFKSIFPHPNFQEKRNPVSFIDMEVKLRLITYMIYICIDWNNIQLIKELFDYFIKSIITINNKVKIKDKNQFSFHNYCSIYIKSLECF